MGSYDWIGVGTILIIIAILLGVFGALWYHDLEYKDEKAFSDYLEGNISYEKYNSTIEDIKHQSNYLEIMNLSSSVFLYIGLLLAIIGVYKRTGENVKQIKEMLESLINLPRRKLYNNFKKGNG